MPRAEIQSVTCLGCGCTCDDINVVVDGLVITDSRNACDIGRQWFGTGQAPASIRVGGTNASFEHAIQRAAAVMAAAARPRVVLGGNVACETYREAVACADLLKARLDILASPATTTFNLAIQEHGIATSTLGEARNRGDVVVFWGVDPDVRFPRFRSRYLPRTTESTPLGALRPPRVLAVDIADARGPVDLTSRVRIDKAQEAETLIALTALVGSRAIGGHNASASLADGVWRVAREIASHLDGGRYVTVVADASGERDDTGRAHRLLALSQALNASSRGSLLLLRDGTNLGGASAVLTRQTGYPASVDFATGVPRYRPHASLTRESHDAMLIIGAPAPALEDVVLFDRSKVVIIGPRASESPFADAAVVIDSGTAGIHTAGTAVRMDDVALPLKAVVAGPPDATDVCSVLLRRLQREAS